MDSCEHVCCPVCGGGFRFVSINEWGRRVARCVACGHIFIQNPLPWSFLVGDYQGQRYFNMNYGHQGITSVEDDAQWTAWIQERVELVEGFLGQEPLRIFEVGCLDGHMLAGLAAKGHTVSGCDLNAEIVQRGREHLGVDIRVGTPSQCQPLAGDMDAVLAFHVLNMVRCPLSAMSEWRRLLRSRGRMLVVVPLGQRDFGYHMCLQYFSRESLRVLAETFFSSFEMDIERKESSPGQVEFTGRLLGTI